MLGFEIHSMFCVPSSSSSLSYSAQNQNGILAMLDEECLRPGTVTDETFLDKLNTICAEHQHFESRHSKNSRFLTDHSLPHNCFRIQHYAGKVRALIPQKPDSSTLGEQYSKI